eukprot:9296206-Prorocentrum_lima.AAC.1
MTSSLVGSEMCIRDRIRDVQARRRDPRNTSESRPHPAARGHVPPDCVCAVSYTHLTLPTICSV